MSNYRVRQVLALGPMPERQLRFLIALATWMTDTTRVVRVGFGELIDQTGNARNTVRAARRELEAAEKLSSHAGLGKGNLTVWVVLCLPETAGGDEPSDTRKGVNETDLFTERKGVSEVNPVSDVDPFADAKGVSQAAEKGSSEASKRGQPQAADRREPDMGFNRLAKPSGSPAAAALIRTAFPGATDDEIESIIADRAARGARSVFSVVRHELSQGALRLPCDPHGPDRHSDACRSGDSARCGREWCACRCHVRPASDGCQAKEARQ